MARVRVAAQSEIPSGAMATFDLDGTPIFVANVDGELYALHNICSHAHAYLSEGELDPDELTVECPLHGSLFDLSTGKPRTLPAFEPVATYKVYVEGDEVFVEYVD